MDRIYYVIYMKERQLIGSVEAIILINLTGLYGGPVGRALER